MKRLFVILLLGMLSFAPHSYAYRPGALPYHKRGVSLKIWYKRDLTYLDQRAWVIEILKNLRSHLARAETLGLSAVQKSSLEGLIKSLEKQMVKAQKELKKLNQEWREEIRRENPSPEKLKEITAETNQIWQDLLKFSLDIYLKAQEVIR